MIAISGFVIVGDQGKVSFLSMVLMADLYRNTERPVQTDQKEIQDHGFPHLHLINLAGGEDIAKRHIPRKSIR